MLAAIGRDDIPAFTPVKLVLDLATLGDVMLS